MNLKWVVTNENRQSLDIALSEGVVVSEQLQQSYNLSCFEQAAVVMVAYFEPSTTDLRLASGLVVLSEKLYYCELLTTSSNWVLVEPVLARIERLHHTVRRRYGSYAEAVRAWEAYRLLASMLASQLPFPWQVLGCDNPTQNISGSTNGANHIVLKGDLTFGRLHRKEHDALCKPCERFNSNLFVEADVPSCKQCLLIAEKMVGVRVRDIQKGSFSLERALPQA